jgi:predicted ribosomally synthesized peptide with SipW-like signal peptide
MSKILLSLMTITLTLTIVGIGVFAAFNDTETSDQNTFTTGTLNLALTDSVDDGTEGETATWNVAALAPGDSGGGERLIINNTGTMAGYLDISSITVTNAENYDATTDEAEAAADGDTSDATGGGELGQQLQVQLWIDANNNGIVDVNGSSNLLETSIFPAAAIGAADPGVTGILNNIATSYNLNQLIGAGSTTYLALLYDLPLSATNGVQGDSATLSFTVELDQIAD